jgi:hypothetical protein
MKMKDEEVLQESIFMWHSSMHEDKYILEGHLVAFAPFGTLNNS